MAKRRTLADLASLHTRPAEKSGLTPEETRSIFRFEPEIRAPVAFHQFDNVRLLVAYRMLRYLGRALSIISRDEPLVTLFNRVNGSPLHSSGQPDGLLAHASTVQAYFRGSPTYLTVHSGEEQVLEHYSRVYGTAALALKMPQNPDQMAVLGDFTDPKRFQEAMPSQSTLEDFEYGLLEAIFDEIVDSGQTEARRNLEEYLNLTPQEAQEMVSTARFVMTAPIELDQETERKIQSERLERMAKTARDTADTRLELAAVKERNRLLGLTDRPPEDSAKQILDVISRVSKEEDPFTPGLLE